MLVAGDGLAHALVGEALHPGQLLGCHFLEVGEVKAQRLRGHQRAFLLDMRAQHLAQRLVQQVGGGVVARYGAAYVGVDCGGERCGGVGGQLGAQMHAHAVLALGVVYLDYLSIGRCECAAVAALAAHLGVEGGAREHYLIVFAAFLLHLAVAQYLGVGAERVVAHKLLLALAQSHPVGGFHRCGGAGAVFLSFHLGVKFALVERHAALLEYQLGKVERETVCVVEHKSLLAADLSLALGLGLGDGGVEHGDAVGQSAQEGVLLLFDYAHDEVALRGQLGICLAHRLDECVDQTVHECLLGVEEGIGVAHGAAQDTAYHIAGLGVGRQLGVGDRESDGAHMVGHHTHCHVDIGVLAILLARD